MHGDCTARRLHGDAVIATTYGCPEARQSPACAPYDALTCAAVVQEFTAPNHRVASTKRFYANVPPSDGVDGSRSPPLDNFASSEIMRNASVCPQRAVMFVYLSYAEHTCLADLSSIDFLLRDLSGRHTSIAKATLHGLCTFHTRRRSRFALVGYSRF